MLRMQRELQRLVHRVARVIGHPCQSRGVVRARDRVAFVISHLDTLERVAELDARDTKPWPRYDGQRLADIEVWLQVAGASDHVALGDAARHRIVRARHVKRGLGARRRGRDVRVHHVCVDVLERLLGRDHHAEHAAISSILVADRVVEVLGRPHLCRLVVRALDLLAARVRHRDLLHRIAEIDRRQAELGPGLDGDDLAVGALVAGAGDLVALARAARHRIVRARHVNHRRRRRRHDGARRGRRAL